jgi:hypothetical protein
MERCSKFVRVRDPVLFVELGVRALLARTNYILFAQYVEILQNCSDPYCVYNVDEFLACEGACVLKPEVGKDASSCEEDGIFEIEEWSDDIVSSPLGDCAEEKLYFPVLSLIRL